MGTHWRSMMDKSTYLGAWDLPEGKDVVVRIKSVSQATEIAGKKTRKPILYFEGKEKGLLLNATNCKTVARLYGHYVEQWAGEYVALYVSTTSSPDGEVPCVRIKPRAPKQTKGRSEPEAPPPAEETGDADGPPFDESPADEVA